MGVNRSLLQLLSAASIGQREVTSLLTSLWSLCIVFGCDSCKQDGGITQRDRGSGKESPSRWKFVSGLDGAGIVKRLVASLGSSHNAYRFARKLAGRVQASMLSCPFGTFNDFLALLILLWRGTLCVSAPCCLMSFILILQVRLCSFCANSEDVLLHVTGAFAKVGLE